VFSKSKERGEGGGGNGLKELPHSQTLWMWVSHVNFNVKKYYDWQTYQNGQICLTYTATNHDTGKHIMYMRLAKNIFSFSS
jgi:hypothetical protein